MRTRLCIQPVCQSSRMPASTSGIAGPAPLPGAQRRRRPRRQGKRANRASSGASVGVREVVEQVMGELAPAQLADERLDPFGATTPFAAGGAAGRETLARRDLAEVQVRGES